MPAPKGHPNYATDDLGGRPRQTDYEEVAKELIAWSELPDSINILGFSKSKPYTYEHVLYMASVDKRILSALKKAKENLSIRREEYLHQNKFNYGVWQRYADVYDPSLLDHEEAKQDRIAKRKQDIDGKSRQDIHVHVDSSGLASGSNISTKKIPTSDHTGSQ